MFTNQEGTTIKNGEYGNGTLHNSHLLNIDPKVQVTRGVLARLHG